MIRSLRLPADRPLALVALLLTAFGLSMVYSAGQTDVPTFVEGLWRIQLAWVVLGVMAGYVITRLSSRLLEAVSVPAYVAACAVLLLLIFIGKGAGTAASTKSWLAVGGVRLGQPSELAKIAVVLMLAHVLGAARRAPATLFELIPSATVCECSPCPIERLSVTALLHPRGPKRRS
jgi:rod shape determining protein RodA